MVISSRKEAVQTLQEHRDVYNAFFLTNTLAQADVSVQLSPPSRLAYS